MELIERIREKCVEVNPEKDWYPTEAGRYTSPEPCRLADVLLAMKVPAKDDEDFVSINQFGNFSLTGQHSVLFWNLREDDLTKQSPETLVFIGKVLGVTS